MTEDSSIPPDDDQPHNPPHWTIETNGEVEAKEVETEKIEEAETKPHSTLDDL